MVTALALSAPTRNAIACKCGENPPSFEEASTKAELAFEGRLVRRWPALIIETNEGMPSLPVLTELYDFEVTRAISGDFSSPPQLYQSGFCGAIFNEGVEYQVIAHRWPRGGRYTTGPCPIGGALTVARNPEAPYPTERPSSAARRAARFATAVFYGSIQAPFWILRSESWNPWDRTPAERRLRAVAALVYPAFWILLVVVGYRGFRKGWNRKRASAALLCASAIPWLALLLARDGWTFEMITR